jgi:hypothetical protein
VCVCVCVPVSCDVLVVVFVCFSEPPDTALVGTVISF